MRMELRGLGRTGNAALDTGIAGIVVHAGAEGVVVYASSGRNGGLVGWRLDAGGELSVQTAVVFPPHLTHQVSERLILDLSSGGPRLILGCDANGLIAWGLGADLSLAGRLGIGWSEARGLARGPEGGGVLEALVTMTTAAPDLLPPGRWSDQIVGLETVTVEGRALVVVSCGQSNAVATYRREGDGRLVLVDEAGAPQGLGLQAPTGMETVTIGSATYAIVVAAGTSSISVMRIGADGSLTPIDHLIDTAATALGAVQALAVAQAGGHTFVVTGGGDQGVSLFLMLPDGRLALIQTLAESGGLTLNNIAAIAAVVQGGQLHVFVTAQGGGGITHLTLDISNLGETRTGSAARAERVAGTRGDDILIAGASGDTLAGGAGDDVLVSGRGTTAMLGGSGRDLFVIRAASTRVEIGDFEPGRDRLDLSDLPMLRDIGQLTIVTTANGARIEYRGTVIVIRSADGQPLTAADLFPDGLGTPDRIPVLDRPDRPVIGRDIVGSEGNDRILGTAGNDTIRGHAGHDLIYGRDGDDLIYGGTGNDRLYGGAGNDLLVGGDGDDRLFGGTGDDTLRGDAGNDRLGGNAGNDWLYGGSGNDTMWGGSGDDRLWGGSGDDLMYGGTGDDRLFGGEGDDTLRGGTGNDLVAGDDGHDLIFGGAGNDTVWGGSGDDRLYGGPGDDLIHGGSGDDRVFGGSGHDTIHGGDGRDLLAGGLGNDLIHAGSGHDTVYGGAGNDVLYGEAGNDLIYGGSGHDRIWGGLGNDTIFAGSGHDTIWGGAGADVFVFFPNQHANRIMDFNPAEGDVLRLRATLWSGAGSLTPAEVVARFGRIDPQGNLVLDFGPVGGTVIVLAGFDDTAALVAAIEIV